MKKYFYFLSILIISLFTACQAEDWDKKDNGENAVNGFTLSYNVNNPISATTRAGVPIEDGEDTINSLYILFFEHSFDGTGQFIEVLDAMEDYKVSLGNSGILTVNFPEGSKLNKSTYYKMLICANLEQYITFQVNGTEDLQDYCEGKTEAEVEGILMVVSGVENPSSPIQEQEDNSNMLPINNIPMSAVATKNADQTTVSIDLVRAVSRFDVSLQASGYRLISASIWNASKQATLWETSSLFSSRTERYYGVDANASGAVTGSLYAFENVSDQPTQGDKETTCLIIGLLKDGNSTVEYFRVNINATEMGQNLKRNNVYNTTIRSVNSTGEACERDAYEQKELLLTIDINGWTLDDSGSIHYDGENILAVPVKTINLFPQGETREYSIFTLGEDGLELELSNVDLPTNITAELQKNLLIVKATASNTPVAGTIELSFGPKLKATIQVTQSAYINDYVELSAYELPNFSQSLGQMSQRITVNSSEAWTAEIYNGTYFSFASDPAQKTVVTGKSGEGFNVFTIKKNESTEPRYSFVVIKLIDKPEVTRVLVLAQNGLGGLSVAPDNRLVQFDAKGVAVTNNQFTVSAFEPNNGQELPWEVVRLSGDDKFEVVKDLYESNKFTITASPNAGRPLTAVYRIRLVNTPDTYTDIQINQATSTTKALTVVTRNNDYGSLYSIDKSHTYYFVYNLATNMRNTNLFGPNGVVYMSKGYSFEQKEKVPDENTNIYQTAMVAPTAANYKDIKKWMDGDKSRILFLSHDLNASTSIKRYEDAFGISGYKVKDTATPAKYERKVYGGASMNNKLISYLFKDGPFTNGQEIDMDRIVLFGKDAVNKGLQTWPSTFIPLIMSGDKKSVTTRCVDDGSCCVFGIDPVNRMIFLGDVDIFGGNNKSYSNFVNFDSNHPENVQFLNNFIAWMTNVALYGEDFLQDFY